MVRRLERARSDALSRRELSRARWRPRRGRAAREHGRHLRGRKHSGDRRRRTQRTPGGQFVRTDQTRRGQQALESAKPDLVIAQLEVVRQRLSRRARHVEIPASGRAHRERERKHPRFPHGVEHLALRLRHDRSEAALPAEIRVADIMHVQTPAALRARPVPIIESRVTNAASASSAHPWVPGGRCGITR